MLDVDFANKYIAGEDLLKIGEDQQKKPYECPISRSVLHKYLRQASRQKENGIPLEKRTALLIDYAEFESQMRGDYKIKLDKASGNILLRAVYGESLKPYLAKLEKEKGERLFLGLSIDLPNLNYVNKQPRSFLRQIVIEELENGAEISANENRSKFFGAIGIISDKKQEAIK
jgi:hypothetical protein